MGIIWQPLLGGIWCLPICKQSVRSAQDFPCVELHTHIFSEEVL